MPAVLGGIGKTKFVFNVLKTGYSTKTESACQCPASADHSIKKGPVSVVLPVTFLLLEHVSSQLSINYLT